MKDASRNGGVFFGIFGIQINLLAMWNEELLKVNALIKLKKYKEAEKLAHKAISEEPDNAHVYFLLCRISILTGNYEKAGEYSDIALRLNPMDPEFLFMKSKALVTQNDLYEAEYFLKEAIKINPLSSEYHAMMGNIKMAQELYEVAAEHLKKALELNPKNVLALNIYSRVLQKGKLSNDTESIIKNALEQDPENWHTYANYGWNLIESGNYEKALEQFKQALYYNPNAKYAKDGLTQALAEHSILYRMLLKTVFILKIIVEKYRVLFYIPSVLILLAANNSVNEPTRKYSFLALVILLPFCLSPLLITPVKNLYLATNKFGKHIVNSKDKVIAIIVGICLFIYIVATLVLIFKYIN